MTDEDLQKWFFEQKVINANNCWEWTGVINGGYGRLSIKGKRVLAHRYALMLHLNRPIPKEMEVRHICNNSKCFNPLHLEEGSHKQNMNDMVIANRQAQGSDLSNKLKGIPHVKARGQSNSNASLSESDALKILSLKGTTPVKELSVLYGVSKNQITRIQNGKSWKHLSRP
jgi:hypothetical protein